MSRLFSNSELALLRRQFFSQVVGQELSQETADALFNAAAAYTKAAEALDGATEALEAAQAAGDVLADGTTEDVLVDGKTLKFVSGLFTGVEE